ncbi:MAG: hypothetical protein M1608_08840 [Candidatus Omnitrophica bacterium]|nr:hypothetical protein [Candidatus Omnitrophota bacterium]
MSFVEFEHQHQAVQILRRSLENGRLGHAYLFTGDDLASLEAAAQTLAKTLNCRQPPRRGATGIALDCCDICSNCRRIADAIHPDVQWIRPESKSRVITIDQMRELMQTIHLKPLEAEYKIAIIVAADRLNDQAGNAFLKTLEEPPDKSVVILLSTQPQRLMETILSRCLRLSFAGENARPLSADQMAWLDTFSTAAGRQNSLLDRYRLLGILQKRLAASKAEIEKTLAARSPAERYSDVDPGLREKREDELAAAIEAEYRHQRTESIACLQRWLRDVWLHTLKLPSSEPDFPGLFEQTAAVAQRISPEDAMENLQIMERTQRLLDTNVQEALVLEVGFIKLKL